MSAILEKQLKTLKLKIKSKLAPYKPNKITYNALNEWSLYFLKKADEQIQYHMTHNLHTKLKLSINPYIIDQIKIKNDQYKLNKLIHNNTDVVNQFKSIDKSKSKILELYMKLVNVKMGTISKIYATKLEKSHYIIKQYIHIVQTYIENINQIHQQCSKQILELNKKCEHILQTNKEDDNASSEIKTCFELLTNNLHDQYHKKTIEYYGQKISKQFEEFYDILKKEHWVTQNPQSKILEKQLKDLKELNNVQLKTESKLYYNFPEIFQIIEDQNILINNVLKIKHNIDQQKVFETFSQFTKTPPIT